MVSAYDMYVSIKVRDVLYGHELNPVGRYLMRLDGGDVALFMGLKAAGLVLVLGFLTALRSYRRGMAFGTTLALCGLQVWLLWYLAFH